MQVRKNSQKFKSDYVFIKNDRAAYLVALWCFIITFVAATFGILPQDVPPTSFTYWQELIMNIATPGLLLALGWVMPTIARRQRKKEQ